MRGIETGKVRIRHEVFTEIARLAYEGGDYAKRLEVHQHRNEDKDKAVGQDTDRKSVV